MLYLPQKNTRPAQYLLNPKIPFTHIIKNQQWHCSCCYFIFFFFHSLFYCLYNANKLYTLNICALSIVYLLLQQVFAFVHHQAPSNKLTPLLFMYDNFLLVLLLLLLFRFVCKSMLACVFYFFLLVHFCKLLQFRMQSFSMQHNKHQPDAMSSLMV